MTSLGVALGTPTYMSPEQATASPQTDHRADIYALGVMTYEMLTGMPPFTGRSPQAVLSAHVVEEAQPVDRRRPAVPPMLAALVHQCLAKRPADRPQSAQDLMHVLDGLATPSGGTVPTTVVHPLPRHPPGSTPPGVEPVQPSRRGWRPVALGAAAVIVVAAVLVSRLRIPAPQVVTPPDSGVAVPSETAPLVSATLPDTEAATAKRPAPG